MNMEWEARDLDLETFKRLDPGTRRLILALLGASGEPTEADMEELASHPQGKMLASWLLAMPAYGTAAPEEDDD